MNYVTPPFVKRSWCWQSWKGWRKQWRWKQGAYWAHIYQLWIYCRSVTAEERVSVYTCNDEMLFLVKGKGGKLWAWQDRYLSTFRYMCSRQLISLRVLPSHFLISKQTVTDSLHTHFQSHVLTCSWIFLVSKLNLHIFRVKSAKSCSFPFICKATLADRRVNHFLWLFVIHMEKKWV